MDGEEREKEILKRTLYYYDKKSPLPEASRQIETFEDLQREVDILKEKNKTIERDRIFDKNLLRVILIVLIGYVIYLLLK